MEKIVLIGAGGHCKVIIDIIKSSLNYDIIGITEKNPKKFVLDVPVIGDDSILKKVYDSGVRNAFICIGALGNMEFRDEIYDNLKKIGFKIPTLIHKDAVVSPYASIEDGSCIMPGAIINAGAKIGKCCIINSGSIVEHDCVIGKNTHISPNAAIAGKVTIGHDCQIGIGSSIIQCVHIGNNVTIGAGAVVIDNICDNVTAVGVPAKIIKCR